MAHVLSDFYCIADLHLFWHAVYIFPFDIDNDNDGDNNDDNDSSIDDGLNF